MKVVLKKLFADFCGLRPNFNKYEVARIGVLKSVNVAFCGMKCLDLNVLRCIKECIKVLGLHISHNKKLQDDKIFVTQ